MNNLTEPPPAQLEEYRRIRTVDGFFGIAMNLIKYGAGVLIAYFMYLMVDSLSGEVTNASIGINILFDSGFLGLLFGVGGTIYGISERQLRKKSVARVQSRVGPIEKLLDDKRSSSTLTLMGDTNPRDE